MNYIVKRPFMDFNQAMKMPGETVEASPERAAKLRLHGLIGGAAAPEAAVRPAGEVIAPPRAENAMDKRAESAETAAAAAPETETAADPTHASVAEEPKSKGRFFGKSKYRKKG